MKKYLSQSSLKKALTQSFLILALSACGGGGSEDSTNTPPTEISPPPVETAPPVEDNTVDNKAEYSGSVSGVVVDASGSPVEGAKVHLSAFETSTDASGAYVFTNIVVTGEHSENLVITIISPDDGSLILEVSPANQVNNSEDSTSFIKDFVIEAPVAKLNGRGTIQGTVMDEDGMPLEGWTVTINSDAVTQISYSTVTGASGYYLFSEVSFYEGQESFTIELLVGEDEITIVEVLPTHQVNNTGGQGGDLGDTTKFIDGFTAQAPTIVLDLNIAPTANAGVDENQITGSLVYLNGNASTDGDGDNLTYSWVLATPNASSAILYDVNTSSPSFVPDVDGTYTATLIVNDGAVDSQPDTVTVTTETFNSVPVANAGQDQSVIVNTLIYLDGNTSSDADNDFLTYSWRFVSKPANSIATILPDNTSSPTFIADASGEFVIELQVSDGVDVSTDNIVVLVEEKNIKLYSVDYFSVWSENAMPYYSSAFATVSILGRNYYEISKFKLTASGKDYVIRNLTATDANSVVVPYFEGLFDGQIIADGTSVEFSLRSPLTRGAQANLNFSFAIEGTTKIFSSSVSLRTN